MRCRACDEALSDNESVRKSLITGEYLDMCVPCCRKAGVLIIEEQEPTTDVEIIPLPDDEEGNEQDEYDQSLGG